MRRNGAGRLVRGPMSEFRGPGNHNPCPYRGEKSPDLGSGRPQRASKWSFYPLKTVKSAWSEPKMAFAEAQRHGGRTRDRNFVSPRLCARRIGDWGSGIFSHKGTETRRMDPGTLCSLCLSVRRIGAWETKSSLAEARRETDRGLGGSRDFFTQSHEDSKNGSGYFVPVVPWCEADWGSVRARARRRGR